MTWTDPTTRSTGDLITAAVWNQDVVDNLDYLYNNKANLQAHATVNDSLSNPTTITYFPTTLTLPANTLSEQNDVIKCVILVSAVTGSSVTTGVSIEVKFGSTTLMSKGMMTVRTNAEFITSKTEIYIKRLSSATSQHIFIDSTGGTYDPGSLAHKYWRFYKTTTEDLSTDLAISVGAKFGASTGGTIDLRGLWFEGVH